MATKVDDLMRIKFTISASANNAVEGIVNKLEESLLKYSSPQIVFLCVGSARINGDSLAPRIGSLLDGKFEVVGTMEDPCHAKNLDSKISFLYNKYSNPFIVAIDASLGYPEEFNRFSVYDGGIKFGNGVGKDLPTIGDISIVGILEEDTGNHLANTFALVKTSIERVDNMAMIISNSIKEVFKARKINCGQEPQVAVL